MKKRNCAKTMVTAMLACSLCGGMITAYAGTDNKAAERQPAGVYGSERAEVSTGAADVPYESPKPSGEDSGGELVELHNPVFDQETGDVTFSYIDFGNYPQGEVTGDALTEEIINAEYVNGDAVVDGIKYRRVSVSNAVATEPAVTGSAMPEPVVTGEAVSGQNRYFKYEPIRWRLVHAQGGQAVLRTDKILDYKIYDGKERFSQNWMGTTLQYWLNGYESQAGFLQTAFSEQEETAIITTEFKDRGYEVADKVYILDCYEWVESKNSFLTSVRVSMAEKSDYANLFSPNRSERAGAWWLRGLGWNTSTRVKPYYNARGIYCWRWYADGFPEYDPERMKAFANDTGIGVCPAVAVDLSKLGFYVQDIEVTDTPATKEPVYSKRPPVVSKEPEVSREPVTSESIGSSEHPSAAPTENPAIPEISDKPLPSEPVVTGDLDGNGKIDLSDAQMVLKAALKIMVLDESGRKKADINRDGKVTLADAQLVLKMALKIIK